MPCQARPGQAREDPDVFQRILIPVDFSDKNAAALDAGLRLARQNQSTVTLLHVLETIEGLDPATDSELDAFFAKLDQSARDRMAPLAERFAERNIPVFQEVVRGRRAEEIVRYAMAQPIDLILVSSHRVTPGDPGRGWGTISYQVAILAPCTVLLVK
jgi:universal stress protein A